MPFRVIRQDITKMNTDAIVNSANPRPAVGVGTDSAIYEAAGAEELLAARLEIGPIGRGQAAVTPGFQLKAKYIIHTVGPVWNDGNQGEEIVLRACYENSLRLAVENGCESIAFPLISTGNYGFPKDLALRIVTEIVEAFLRDHEMMIYLVVYDRIAAKLSQEVFSNIRMLISDEDIAASESHLPDDFPGWDRRRRDQREDGYFPQAGREDYNRIRNTMQTAGAAPLPGGGRPAPGSGVKKPAPSAPMPGGAASQKQERKRGLFSRREDHLDELQEEAFYGAPSPAKPASASASVPAGAAYSGRKLKDLVKHPQETFQQMLLRLIQEKGMTNAEVYQKANQDKKLFSKIKHDEHYQPKKKTAMAFALALELSLDETIDLLARAGYAFSPSSPFDMAIQYFIETGKFNIYDIEIILFDLGLDSLCNY